MKLIPVLLIVMIFVASFINGVYAQWKFNLAPEQFYEKEIKWVTPPKVTTIHNGKICYIWEIQQQYDKHHQLRVCRFK